MCIEILVKKDGREYYCDNVGELADALSVFPSVVSPDSRECCLCNAYLNALNARHATAEEGFPWPEYIIEVEPATPPAPSFDA
jgi:hypothetical protein